MIVSVLKKKRIHNPNLQYRKAKEPTVKLNGLTKKVELKGTETLGLLFATKSIRN